MNVFIVPSWYPSASNPIYGTFNYEQARLLAQHRPGWNIGVSVWGQGDDRLLVYARKLGSIRKLLTSHPMRAHYPMDNLGEYFAPAFTWSRKIFKGNIKGIIKANELNLMVHIDRFGMPDVLSAQASYPAAIVAAVLSQRYAIPYTVTVRMSPFPFNEFLNANGSLKQIIARPLTNASALIATSTSLKTTLHHFGLHQVHVVNNPVDTGFFKPKPRKEAYCLLVGRMEEQKGVDLLLRAFASIESDLKLRLAGEGSLCQEYKDLARHLDIEHKVEWLGELSREEVRNQMQGCSFYVLSSRHETFGNVLLEAMSCGKPVLATECGGPSDIVDERTGILCETSAEGLRSGLEIMLKKRAQFNSNEIRSYVESNFSPSVWAQNLESVFKSIL